MLMNQELGFQFYRNIITNTSILKLRKLHKLKHNNSESLSSSENPLQNWFPNMRFPALSALYYCCFAVIILSSF